MGRKPAANSRSITCICRGLSSNMDFNDGPGWQEPVCPDRRSQRQAAVESAASDGAPSSCDKISRSVVISSSRDTWLFLN